MKPMVHARISAKRYGGDPEDYLPIHDWLDSTKTWLLTFWLLGVCGISGFIGYIKGHVDGWNEAFRWHMERGYHNHGPREKK